MNLGFIFVLVRQDQTPKDHVINQINFSLQQLQFTHSTCTL